MVGAAAAAGAGAAGAGGDPLPSWNDGATKHAILDFVAAVTEPASPDFLPVPERVAVFDNDGTLWVEQPYYTQMAFALDRAASLAPAHPEWADHPGLSAALARDMPALAAVGVKGLSDVVCATHAHVTTDAFEAEVRSWIATAVHPRFGRRYNELVYQPMLELLAHLRAAGFANYIVSGGGVEFVRPWAEAAYGIPPERVIGSWVEARYEPAGGDGGGPVLVRAPKVGLYNDGPAKPAAINLHIGRRPVLAAGNSDGDYEMIEWTTAAPPAGAASAPAGGRRLGLLVHHTDAKREFAYDKDTAAGRLVRGLADAGGKGWVLADMARDWRVVFPFELEGGGGGSA
ncbi:MAG: NapD-like protein [Monoraphidium minutum]|nr:MAG: NapD-like protein [Monoraphidium minutum]